MSPPSSHSILTPAFSLPLSRIFSPAVNSHLFWQWYAVTRERATATQAKKKKMELPGIRVNSSHPYTELGVTRVWLLRVEDQTVTVNISIIGNCIYILWNRRSRTKQQTLENWMSISDRHFEGCTPTQQLKYFEWSLNRSDFLRPLGGSGEWAVNTIPRNLTPFTCKLICYLFKLPADTEQHSHSLSCFWLPVECKSNIHPPF